MSDLRLLSGAAIAVGALAVGALGFPAVAAAESNLAPPMVTTTCSLDQIMAATRVADPVTYGALTGRFNAQPRWVQGGIIYHMNTLLQAPPPQRWAGGPGLGAQGSQGASEKSGSRFSRKALRPS